MIRIICIGKIKENFYREALEEYQKRLGKYTKLEIIELPDYNYDIPKTLKEEYNSMMKYYNKSDYNILLDISGTTMDSITFAKEIDSLLMEKGNITFFVGGSYGVLDDLRSQCDLRLSFSKMTFPHQLFRVILLEQLYRAFKIINHEEYHK